MICAPTTYCANSVGGAPRLCQAKKPDGQPCSDGAECFAHYCNANRYGADAGPSVCGCDAMDAPCGFDLDCSSTFCLDSVCVAAPANQPLGSPCGANEHCDPSLYCKQAGETPGTCQPRLDAGVPCYPGNDCIAGFTCSQSLEICVPIGHQGQSCGELDAGGYSDNSECTELLWCNSGGTCVPWLGLGDACDDPRASCASSACAVYVGGSFCSGPIGAPGAVCALSSDCQSYRCLQDDGGYLDAFHLTGLCGDLCF